MKKKWMAWLCLLALTLCMVACGKEEETTTLTGMVVSVDGTVISLMETDGNMSGNRFSGGEMPTMPEGMEGFQGFENFDPEQFEGTFPEGEDMPQWGGGNFPQWGDGEMPEGMTIPEDGEMPDFGGGFGGMLPNSGEIGADVETKEIDIADAHISVEIDGGKATGSLEDIEPGVIVTVTMNGKGEVTNVLVSAGSGFSGGNFFGSKDSQSSV